MEYPPLADNSQSPARAPRSPQAQDTYSPTTVTWFSYGGDAMIPSGGCSEQGQSDNQMREKKTSRKPSQKKVFIVREGELNHQSRDVALATHKLVCIDTTQLIWLVLDRSNSHTARAPPLTPKDSLVGKEAHEERGQKNTLESTTT